MSEMETWRIMNKKIDRLERELAEAKKDAERYRWLRDSASKYDGDKYWHFPYCNLGYGDEMIDGEKLDAAIDQAMKGE